MTHEEQLELFLRHVEKDLPSLRRGQSGQVFCINFAYYLDFVPGYESTAAEKIMRNEFNERVWGRALYVGHVRYQSPPGYRGSVDHKLSQAVAKRIKEILKKKKAEARASINYGSLTGKPSRRLIFKIFPKILLVIYLALFAAALFRRTWVVAIALAIGSFVLLAIRKGLMPRLVYMALLQNKAKKIHTFLLLGANPNGHLTQLSLLHLACMNCVPEGVRLLVDAGADLEATDDLHQTPLHKAIMSRACRDSSGDLTIVRMLVEAGADLKAKTKAGRTPLQLAMHERKNHITQYLGRFEGLELINHEGVSLWGS